MWVSQLTLSNFRSFESLELRFSRGLNMLIGRNNAGKSSILRALSQLQEGLDGPTVEDLRWGAKDGNANIALTQVDPSYFRGKTVFGDKTVPDVVVEMQRGQPMRYGYKTGATLGSIPRIADTEPGNFIFPFLSKRKTATLFPQVNAQAVQTVEKDFQHLTAKIDNLSRPGGAKHAQYADICAKTLGLLVTAYPSPTRDGKEAGYGLEDIGNIGLPAMGDGTMNIVGLAACLCAVQKKVQNKLFLIEEPENDIHPSALKTLLGVIAEKAQSNQFIITTHSNIV